MRHYVTATAVGAVAAVTVLYAAAMALGIMAQTSDWGSFSVTLGGLRLFVYERAGDQTATTFGNGLLLVALGLGVLNGVGAVIIRRRGAFPKHPV